MNLKPPMSLGDSSLVHVAPMAMLIYVVARIVVALENNEHALVLFWPDLQPNCSTGPI